MMRRAALAVGLVLMVAILAIWFVSQAALSDRAMTANFRDHRADSARTVFFKNVSLGGGDIRGYYYSEVARHPSETMGRDIMSHSPEVRRGEHSTRVTRYRPLAPGWYLYRQRSVDGD